MIEPTEPRKKLKRTMSINLFHDRYAIKTKGEHPKSHAGRKMIEIKRLRKVEAESEFKKVLESLILTLAKYSAKIDNIYEEELPKMASAINNLLNKLERLEEKLDRIEERLKEQEAVTIVKEISLEEAKKIVEEYISHKKGEIITPLELSDALQIPYEIAHEVFLQLIEEGKLEIKDVEEY
jgi:hypothetical protein